MAEWDASHRLAAPKPVARQGLNLLYPAPPWHWSARKALIRYWLTDPVAGLGDLVVHNGLRLLPSEKVSDFGAWMGLRAGRKRPEASARARALFRQLRPDADAAAIEAMLRAHWSHVGRCFSEFAAQFRFFPEGRVSIEGREHPLRVRAEGRPLIVAGLHVGNWELVHAALSHLGIPFSGIYQRLPNRFRMRLADSARQRGLSDGGKTLVRHIHPTLAAPFEAHRALESRDSALLYYVDEYWQGRVHAPALGRTPRMEGNIMRAVRLAASTGASIVPAYALREGEGPRFRVFFLPEITVGPAGRGRAAVLEDIARLDAVLEKVVRAHPEQWFMAHVFRMDR